MKGGDYSAGFGRSDASPAVVALPESAQAKIDKGSVPSRVPKVPKEISVADDVDDVLVTMKTLQKAAAKIQLVSDVTTAVPDVAERRLSLSVQRGELNSTRALNAIRFVDGEVRKLIAGIKKFGSMGSDGVGIVRAVLARNVTDIEVFQKKKGVFLSAFHS